MMIDLSPNDDKQNNHLLHAYITEQAVKQQTMKQHQSYDVNRNNHVNSSTLDLPMTAIHPNTVLIDKHHDIKFNFDSTNTEASSTFTTLVSTTVVNTAPVSNSSTLVSSSSSSSKLIFTMGGGNQLVQSKEDNINDLSTTKSNISTTTSNTAVNSILDSCVGELSHPIAKENALDILAKTSLASDAAKKQAMKLSSTNSNASSINNATNSSPNKKLKAEFLPPSSGPSPSYVRLDIFYYCVILGYTFCFKSL